MDMKKILQALDGASTRPVEGSDEMSKFLRLVKEAGLNQPAHQDPNFVKYSELMAKYDLLQKEMTPDDSGVEKGASPDAIAAINAIKSQAEQLAGPNAQAWEQARQKENADSMAQAQANHPALAQQLEAVGMSRLLSIVTEGPTAPSLGGYSCGFLEKIVITNTAQQGITPQQALQELKTRVGNQDPHDPAPSPGFVNKYLSKKLEEGANPHKVALPVQMAMQQYQAVAKPTVRKDRLIDKYFTEADAAITQRKEEKRALINQYASVIAERVMMKESKLDERSTSEKQARMMAAAAHNPEFAKKVGIKTSVAKEFNKKDKGTALLSNAMKGKKKVKEHEIPGHSMGFTGGVGPGLQSIEELSTELLGKYKKAAGADASKADKEGDFARGNKRFSGIVKATKKQFANDAKGMSEGLDQLLALRDKIDEAIQKLNKQ